MADAPKQSNGLIYADAGVDIDAGNALVDRIRPVVASTRRTGSNPDLGSFGGLFDLSACGYSDPVLVAATDGVGTKLRLAIDSGSFDGIGIDLVAMCVNDLIVQGAEPLFFLDYLATGKLSVDVGVHVVEGIAEGCRQAGAALIGGEIAEMPGFYQANDLDLAGFAVGAVERDRILPSSGIGAGDVLLGLASDGLHSNGFSLVRKIVELTGADLTGPAPYGRSQILGADLLTPTRIYVRSLLSALRGTQGVKALAHITGGGLTENLPRVLPGGIVARIDLASWSPAPVFAWLSRSGGVAPAEMLRTFNCGIGMVVVVASRDADAVRSVLEQNGERVCQLGALVTGDAGGKVAYVGELAGIGAP